MTQTQIDLAVARATGEPLSEIRRMGFCLVDPSATREAHAVMPRSKRPNTVNWDQLDASRPRYLPQHARRQRQSA